MAERRRCAPGEVPCKPYRAPLYSSSQGTVTVYGKTAQGQDWQNSYGYAAPSTITQSEADALVASFVQGVVPNYLNALHSTSTLDGVRFRNRTVSGDVNSLTAFTPARVGLDLTDGLPSQTSLSASKVTNHAGSSRNGFVKMPPTGEGSNTDGRANAGYLTRVATIAGDVLRQNFLGRLKHAVLSSLNLTPSRVLSIGANTIWDSALTRKAGKGS